MLKARNLVFTLADNQAFALRGLTGQFTNTAHAFRFFAGTLFRRLFIVIAELHFTEDTFTLKLFLQNLIGLINIVITNRNLHVSSPLKIKFQRLIAAKLGWFSKLARLCLALSSAIRCKCDRIAGQTAADLRLFLCPFANIVAP